jgi:multidrug efflux pump subunit AcrA (membrane-fusion protein)
MSPASTAAGLGARDTLHSVDQILEELDRLATAELTDSDFYAAVMTRLSSLGCSAAAIWTVDTDGAPQLAWQSPGSPLTTHNSPLTGQQSAVATAIQSVQPTLIEKPTAGNGASSVVHSIIAPWSPANISHGALQVWLADKVTAEAVSGYLQVLAAVGELVAMFFARQEQRRLRQRLDQQSQLDVFERSIHESLDIQQVAYRIANDGRLLIACDRMAVAIRHGSRFRISAVSGADQVHRRSESIEQLQHLCRAVVLSGEPLWHSSAADQSPDMPPQISEALSAYLDLSPAVALAVIPLFPPPKGNVQPPPITVLVLEQYDRPFDAVTGDLVAAIAEHCRLAITNAEQLAAIPGHKLWLAVAKPGRLSRWSSRTLAAAAVLTAMIVALIVIPAEVRIKARGELQPAVRQDVFAPRDGVVTKIHVDHGQQVHAGDTLIEIRSPELELEMQRVAGELETARKRLAAAQSERLQLKSSDTDARLRQRRLTAEEEQYQQQVRDLANRQSMLQTELEALTVHSPLSGEVVTWNVEQQLTARPLKRGDALLTVADIAGPWQLELKVPSRRAGRLLAARGDAQRPVSFVLATNPGQTLEGKVTEIAPRLEIDDSGESYILATVEVPRDQIDNRAPGATAFARIDCGRGSLAEAWFHDLIDAARLWMPF